jgi:hypothetical protein
MIIERRELFLDKRHVNNIIQRLIREKIQMNEKLAGLCLGDPISSDASREIINRTRKIDRIITELEAVVNDRI